MKTRKEEKGIVTFCFGILCGLVLFPLLWVFFWMAVSS